MAAKFYTCSTVQKYINTTINRTLDVETIRSLLVEVGFGKITLLSYDDKVVYNRKYN